MLTLTFRLVNAVSSVRWIGCQRKDENERKKKGWKKAGKKPESSPIAAPSCLLTIFFAF
jgi:hypothetical protein